MNNNEIVTAEDNKKLFKTNPTLKHLQSKLSSLCRLMEIYPLLNPGSVEEQTGIQAVLSLEGRQGPNEIH